MHPLEEAALRAALASVFLRVEVSIYVTNMTQANNDKVRQTIDALKLEVDICFAVLDNCPPTKP